MINYTTIHLSRHSRGAERNRESNKTLKQIPAYARMSCRNDRHDGSSQSQATNK